MAEKKLPSIQIYPGDWLRDPVAGCSLAAQGLWWRMMMLMHDSERYGYLSTNGSPIPSGTLARRINGCDSLEQYETLLRELDSVGVPSRTDSGIIFSRRMVRDQKARDVWRRQKENQRNSNPVSKSVHQLSTRCPPPSSVSSSSSISSSTSKQEKARAVENFFLFWNPYPRKEGKKKAMEAWCRINPDEATVDKIFTALQWQVYSRQWLENPGFIPHPTTYLNGERWNDERGEQELLCDKCLHAQEMHGEEGCLCLPERGASLSRCKCTKVWPVKVGRGM